MGTERQGVHRGPSREARCPTPGSDPTGDPPEVSNGEVIEDLINDLVAKQQALSALIDGFLEEEVQSPDSLSVQALGRLMALHSQNASRLGRLLRDKRALSGEAADGIAAAMAQAMDELRNEWGVAL
jgi:hypothetical protein